MKHIADAIELVEVCQTFFQNLSSKPKNGHKTGPFRKFSGMDFDWLKKLEPTVKRDKDLLLFSPRSGSCHALKVKESVNQRITWKKFSTE